MAVIFFTWNKNEFITEIKRESYLFRLEGSPIQSGDFDCWKTNDFIRENNRKRVQANKEKVFYLPEFLHTET